MKTLKLILMLLIIQFITLNCYSYQSCTWALYQAGTNIEWASGEVRGAFCADLKPDCPCGGEWTCCDWDENGELMGPCQDIICRCNNSIKAPDEQNNFKNQLMKKDDNINGLNSSDQASPKDKMMIDRQRVINFKLPFKDDVVGAYYKLLYTRSNGETLTAFEYNTGIDGLINLKYKILDGNNLQIEFAKFIKQFPYTDSTTRKVIIVNISKLKRDFIVNHFDKFIQAGQNLNNLVVNTENFNPDLSNGNMKVVIYDLNGKELSKKELSQSLTSISLPESTSNKKVLKYVLMDAQGHTLKTGTLGQ